MAQNWALCRSALYGLGVYSGAAPAGSPSAQVKAVPCLALRLEVKAGKNICCPVT